MRPFRRLRSPRIHPSHPYTLLITGGAFTMGDDNQRLMNARLASRFRRSGWLYCGE
jgi:hypothetical protein